MLCLQNGDCPMDARTNGSSSLILKMELPSDLPGDRVMLWKLRLGPLLFCQMSATSRATQADTRLFWEQIEDTDAVPGDDNHFSLHSRHPHDAECLPSFPSAPSHREALEHPQSPGLIHKGCTVEHQQHPW